MVFSSIVHRGSAFILTVTIRSVGSQRAFHSAISAVRSEEVGRQFIPILQFSTAASVEPNAQVANLVHLLESRIESAKQRSHVQDIPAADGFLFRIEDVYQNPIGDIYMRGKYQNENIEVKVHSPKFYERIEVPASLGLSVTISKRDIGDENLSFRLTTSPDEITIEQVSITTDWGCHYFKQDFNDLDENLQKVFHKYLENRGIKHICLRNLFSEYYKNKEKEKDLNWLKGVKAFMEKSWNIS